MTAHELMRLRGLLALLTYGACASEPPRASRWPRMRRARQPKQLRLEMQHEATARSCLCATCLASRKDKIRDSARRLGGVQP